VNTLTTLGAHVKAFDPQAKEEASHMIDKAAVLSSNIEEALEGANAVIVATDWPEFLAYDLHQYAGKLSGNILVDAMNRFDPHTTAQAGLRHIGVGRGLSNS
jgi:UDPglucose 6-dehydrogenase